MISARFDPSRRGARSPEASRRELAAALLCAAVRAGLFGGGDGAEEGGGEEERGDGAGERSALARRLASAVPLPPSMRIYRAQGREGNGKGDGDGERDDDDGGARSAESSRARSLLEGTALAEALAHQAEDMASEGAQVVEQAVRALSLEAEEAAARSWVETLPPSPASRAAERAGAWALSVVDGAAIPGPSLLLPQVIAPLASAVPRCFRGAAVDFEWVCSSDDDGGEEPSLSSFSLVVRAAADLPRGIEFRRGCALVGQTAFDVALAGGLEALPALLPCGAAEDNPAGCLSRPEERPRLRSISEGHGGQAVWHCFEREFSLGGIALARKKEDSRKKRDRESAGTEALSLAQRAADACGLLPASSGAGVEVIIALGRPTPKHALAALALSFVALPQRSSNDRGSGDDASDGGDSDDSDGGGDGSEAQHQREAIAALKQAGLKRLLRSRKAADAAASAASSSKGAGRDDAAAAALEAERASDDFLREIPKSRFGGKARRALRRSLRGEAGALSRRREAEEEEALPDPTGMVAGARIYRKGVLAALREHAAVLEER